MNQNDKNDFESTVNNNQKIVFDNYSKFKNYNGSEHIATMTSMMNLLEIIQNQFFLEVLDFGAGIGTISALVLDNTNANITAVEKDEWCAKEFAEHLLPNERITLSSSLPKKRFELCIIDDLISLIEIMRIFGSSSGKVIIFIEGRRSIAVALFSLIAMFYRYSGSYFESARNLNLDEKNCIEKGGSYFIFKKSTLFRSVESWVKRIRRKEERDNLKFFFLKKSRLLSIMNKFR